MGRTAIGACGAALVLCTTATPAKAGKRAVCTAAYVAYKSALERQQAGQPGEARELLSTCMQATVCGGLVPKCRALYDKLAPDKAAPDKAAPGKVAPRKAAPGKAVTDTPSADTPAPDKAVSDKPTVVPFVTDESGAQRVDVQVKVDGELLTSRPEGKALPVPAGLHEFTFSTDRGVFATQKLLVSEGQRNRPIVVTMGKGRDKATAVADGTPIETADKSASDQASDKSASAEGTTDAPTPSGGGKWALPRSVFPYVIGGVGLAGLGAGALLTYWGRRDNDLLAQCAPTCLPSNIDHIRSLYIAADVSIGVGLSALGVATWLFATSRSKEERPQTESSYVLDVHAVPSGAFASVKKAF